MHFGATLRNADSVIFFYCSLFQVASKGCRRRVSVGKLGSKTVFTAVPREDGDGWRGQTGVDLLGVVQAERPAGIKQDAIDWTSTLLQPTHISLASSGFWAS